MPKPTALGGNIFAGLFTRGIVDAGFSVLGHLEHGPYGVGTAKLNFPNLDVRYPVENWVPTDFTGKVDFMYCNPPCAPWSNSSGRQKDNWRTDDRTSCVKDLVAAGLMIKPKAWAWESVVPAWTKGREFVLAQAELWYASGYSVTILLQNNMYLGAPQCRKRMFVIAHKHPLVWQPFTLNPPTIAEILNVTESSEAELAQVQLDGFYRKLWETCPQHKFSFAQAAESLTLAERQKLPYFHHPTFLAGRLEPERVCPVLMSNDQQAHPFEPRFLTLSEMKALCGLPKTWKPNPKYSEAGQEMARAVLPDVGKWLGRTVKEGLKLPCLDSHTIRMIDFRKPSHIAEEFIA